MKQKRYLKTRITSVILAVVMLLTVGCSVPGNTAGEGGSGESQDINSGSKANSNEADGAAEKAMGRYVEDSQDLSEMITRAAGMVHLPDGSIVIQDYYNGQIVSKDNGASWNLLPQQWMEDMYAQSQYIDRIALSSDGYIALAHILTEESESEDAMNTPLLWQYTLIDPEGKLIPIETGIDSGERLMVWFAEDGSLFLTTGNGNKMYSVNKETGQAELYMEMAEDIGYLSYLFMGDDSMLMLGDNGTYLYDRVTKEKMSDDVLTDFIESISDASQSYSADSPGILPFQEEAGILYLAFRDGLFRHAMGGSAMEQVIDGGLSTFGDPSVGLVMMMALENNEFLALFTGGKVVRYSYDADMPTVPDKQLKVYSLENNLTIRQAIAVYQAKYPEVYVNYEIGIDESSSVTREDALKKLNTEIMAGNGPDVILLDDMPINSYINKGILADLTPYLKEIEEEEGLNPNLKQTYQREGGIYAIPALYSVPVMMGTKEDINKMNDLEGMADAIEDIRNKNPEGNILGVYTPYQALKLLSISCAGAWQNEDGSINEQMVSQFLTQAKRIYDAEAVGISDESMNQFEEMNIGTFSSEGISYEESDYYLWANINSYHVVLGDSKAAAGYINDGFSLSTMTSAIEMITDREVGFRAMGGQLKDKQEGNYYSPSTIAGISASSNQQELAGTFVKEFLSAETLNNIYNGYPINETAFEQKFVNVYNEDGSRIIGAMGLAGNDGNSVMLDINWPTEDMIKQFRIIMEAADTPNITDSVIVEAVLEEGVYVLKGESSVNQAVNDIMKKLMIYLGE